MNANKKFLIDHLQQHNLNHRYENSVVINCDPLTGQKIGQRGALSVVFQATDNTNNEKVAIKFFDPDIRGAGVPYRLDLFERENDLLTSLSGGTRTLRITQPLTDLPLQLSMPGGQNVIFNYRYFVTEWLDGDIEQYFLNQTQYSNEEKLNIFRECCLAVFALHGREIAHRDVKPDNLRLTDRNGKQVAVAIDLGTAAANHSPSLGGADDYLRPVGALAYAPLEARGGLAGVRELGYTADYYALGCLLYELFNADFYYAELLNNLGYQSCRSACELHMFNSCNKVTDSKTLLKEWNWIISKTQAQVALPRIDGASTTIRPSVIGILNMLLMELTSLDFQQRLNDITRTLRLIDSALRILRNHAADRVSAARRKQRRENRLKREMRKQQKLTQYLQRHSQGITNVH